MVSVKKKLRNIAYSGNSLLEIIVASTLILVMLLLFNMVLARYSDFKNSSTSLKMLYLKSYTVLSPEGGDNTIENDKAYSNNTTAEAAETQVIFQLNIPMQEAPIHKVSVLEEMCY